jgi:hypothetical protein
MQFSLSMKRGFYTIMSRSFQLAGRQRLVRGRGRTAACQWAPEWQRAALVPMFALFYVVLAPFVGAFADAVPKGKVMFISNAIKVVGCLMMLSACRCWPMPCRPGRGGLFAGQVRHPDRAAAGLAAGQGQWLDRGADHRLHHPGRAAGRPAGGHRCRACCWASTCRLRHRHRHPAEAAICVLIFVYALAAWFNPASRTPAWPCAAAPARAERAANALGLLPDFWHCNGRLWRDKLGQISLATTTLFWGVAGNLRYIVLAWAPRRWATAPPRPRPWWAWWPSARPRRGGGLDAHAAGHATSVMPLGIAMGLLVV